ncbi:MAG: hypothetical protein L3J06_05140 [Cyclobacteriaceae bacterium]|nr:hypothetical protein [Cyclobacteriaceae bacterium]
MKGRTFTPPLSESSATGGDSEANYRYGFNGKERDPNLGGGTHYDYGFRIYNPRIAKFLSTDPLAQEYPWYTPYQFAGNRPIAATDVDGLEDQLAIDGSLVQGPVDIVKVNKDIVRKTLNQYIAVMSTKPISSAKKSLNQTFIGPNNSTLTYKQNQARIRKLEFAQNYQNLQNSVPLESRLIGEGVGIGLSMSSLGGGIGLASKGLKARTLIGAAKSFGLGFGANAGTQLVFNGFQLEKVDLANATSSGLTSLITKKYGTNFIVDAGISSTVNFSLETGLVTVFNGSKSKEEALIDFGLGIGTGLLGSGTDKVLNLKNSRAYLKNLNPALRKIMTEVIKGAESGAAGKVKEKLDSP